MYQQYVYQQINANDYKNVHNQKNLITQIVAFITCSLTLLHQKIFEWFIFVVKNDLNFSYCTWAVQHTTSKKNSETLNIFCLDCRLLVASV